MSADHDRALNALFDAEREALAVAPHATLNYHALLDRLASGAQPSVDVPPGSPVLSGTARVLGAWPAGVAVVAVVAGLWGAAPWPTQFGQRDVPSTRIDTSAETPQPAGTSASDATRVAPVQADAPTGVAAEAEIATADTRAPESARRAPASTRAENLAEELRLLAGARLAWKSGRRPEALGWLAQHAQRFPRGLLSEDRGALEAVLLCETGKLAQGREKARRFLAKHPQSTLVDTVRGACL